MNLLRRILDYFDPPKCKFCKDSGLLHHLGPNGFERRPCRYCDVYAGEWNNVWYGPVPVRYITLAEAKEMYPDAGN